VCVCEGLLVRVGVDVHFHLHVFKYIYIYIYMFTCITQEDMPLEAASVSDSLDRVQKNVEEYFYGIRKEMFKYDEILSTQREALYSLRRKMVRASILVVSCMHCLCKCMYSSCLCIYIVMRGCSHVSISRRKMVYACTLKWRICALDAHGHSIHACLMHACLYSMDFLYMYAHMITFVPTFQTDTRTHTYTHILAYIHTNRKHPALHMPNKSKTYLHADIRTYEQAHTHTKIRTHTYIYHTYMQVARPANAEEEEDGIADTMLEYCLATADEIVPNYIKDGVDAPGLSNKLAQFFSGM